MFSGKPTTGDEQPSVTDSSGDEETENGTDGGNNNDTSTVSTLLDTARTVSDIVAPFAGLATAVVNAITAWKFIKEAT